MTDEGPRSCSPNEFAALIIYLNAPKPVEGEGVMLAPCFLLTPCLLSLVMSLVWQSPRRYPGHTSTWHAPAAWSPCPWVSPAHASAAASWWLWTPYYWAPRSLECRRVEEKIEGQQPVERWWNNSHGISKTFFFFSYWWFPSVRVRQLRTVTVEQSEHHIAHVIRQLHFGNGARHLLHGDWEEEGGKHRQRNSPFVGWRNRGASHTIQLINVPMWRTLWAKQFGINLEQGSCLPCRHMEEHEGAGRRMEEAEEEEDKNQDMGWKWLRGESLI